MKDVDLKELVPQLVQTAHDRVAGDIECMVGRSQGFAAGSQIDVEVTVEVGSWFSEVHLRVDSIEIATEVMRSLKSVPLASWNVDPFVSNGVGIHAALSDRQLLDLAQGYWNEDPDRPSHIVLSDELTDSLVHAQAIRSLCGAIFVPTETGDPTRDRDVCERCALVFALATKVSERLDGSFS